jgi:hypothetical protein
MRGFCSSPIFNRHCKDKGQGTRDEGQGIRGEKEDFGKESEAKGSGMQTDLSKFRFVHLFVQVCVSWVVILYATA